MRLLIKWFPDRRPPRHCARHSVLATARPAKGPPPGHTVLFHVLSTPNGGRSPSCQRHKGCRITSCPRPKVCCCPKKSLVSASKKGCSSWLLTASPGCLTAVATTVSVRLNLTAAAAIGPHPPGKTTRKKTDGWGRAAAESNDTAAHVNATPPHGGQSDRRLSAARTALSGVHRHGAVDDRDGLTASPSHPPPAADDATVDDGGGTTTAG